MVPAMLLSFGSSVRPRQEFQEERIPAKFRKDGEFLQSLYSLEFCIPYKVWIFRATTALLCVVGCVRKFSETIL